MTWCPHCSQNTDTHRDFTTGSVCCVDCGKVVSQDLYTEETTFAKDASGAARREGNIVRASNACAESHRRTLNKGNDVINELISINGISNVGHATNYYQIAVERGFTRGRRTDQVAAACLYVACREMEKPFLLIEFSSELGVSVYELGTVYLQLCKLLSLQDHPFVQKPVDPSLYMHRYTSGLVKDGNNKKVLNTALHLVVSMKKDWIPTGRKPSGICAAAIYVSSLLHGYNFSKSDVVKTVHICEATLTKRLIEFENTEAGSLTIEEFTQNALNYEKEMQSCKQSADNIKMPGLTEVVCQHKSNAVQSGFGLCTDCYMEFCGGLEGSEPPAFQRAELERLSKESVKRLTEPTPQNAVHNENGTLSNTKEIDDYIRSPPEVERVAAPDTQNPNKVGDAFESSKEAEAPADESDTLSDIDDSEVMGYLNNKEETEWKQMIWERIPENREYMLEQAAKEAAAAAARVPQNLTSEEARAAHALAAKAAQAVASKKEKDKKKRQLEAQNAKPAQTAAEAAGQHFKKKLSSKINMDAWNNLFGDEEPSLEKNRVDDDSNAKGQKIANKLDDDNNNDDDDADDEWNYDNAQQMSDGYVDDDFF